MSEIDLFPRAVLSHHFKETPLHGDFTTIETGNYEPIDLLVGGTPCQSFSVAGLRGGMEDARGNLALEYLRLADRLRPRWLVWENVPGIRSSNGGRDFGAFLGGLGQLGYGWAYRSLDAQYLGLAQRRERVFVVGCLGDWRRAAAVLFEPASLRGDPPPSRKAGQGVAPTISSRPTGGGGLGTDFDLDGGLIAAIQERAVCENASAGPDGVGIRTDGLAYTLEARSVPHAVAFGGNNTAGPIDVATDVNAHGGPHGRLDFESETFVADLRNGTVNQHTAMSLQSGGMGTDRGLCPNAIPHVVHTLRREGHDVGEDGAGHGAPLVAFLHANKGRPDGRKSKHTEMVTVETETVPTLATDGHSQSAVAFHQNQRAEVTTNDTTGALNSGGGKPGQGYPAAMVGSGVRRLTPVECEKLQGFQPGYTDVPYRGKLAADGPRYKALGNSMAVPVMAWIGRRIAEING